MPYAYEYPAPWPYIALLSTPIASPALWLRLLGLLDRTSAAPPAKASAAAAAAVVVWGAAHIGAPVGNAKTMAPGCTSLGCCLSRLPRESAGLHSIGAMKYPPPPPLVALAAAAAGGTGPGVMSILLPMLCTDAAAAPAAENPIQLCVRNGPSTCMGEPAPPTDMRLVAWL
ncbi:hypothetical protein Vafri_1286 [Volvox africanus]|nr:hypothetical protein Vafri_1286 [Volvox africanus]